MQSSDDGRVGRGACIPLPEDPGVFLAFPAVCFQKQHAGTEAMNDELRRLILEDERREPSPRHGVSIRGGFHSDTDFFEREHPAVRALKSLLVQDLAQYTRAFWSHESAVALEHVKGLDDVQIRLWGWSVVLREGDYSELHTHPHANLSGVYYVSDAAYAKDDVPNAGSLVLCDPRPAANVASVLGQISSLKIPPSPGGTVMFPSYMQHYVLPFRGSGERISVAFNVLFVGAAADPVALRAQR